VLAGVRAHVQPHVQSATAVWRSVDVAGIAGCGWRRAPRAVHRSRRRRRCGCRCRCLRLVSDPAPLTRHRRSRPSAAAPGAGPGPPPPPAVGYRREALRRAWGCPQLWSGNPSTAACRLACSCPLAAVSRQPPPSPIVGARLPAVCGGHLGGRWCRFVSDAPHSVAAAAGRWAPPRRSRCSGACPASHPPPAAPKRAAKAAGRSFRRGARERVPSAAAR